MRMSRSSSDYFHYMSTHPWLSVILQAKDRENVIVRAIISWATTWVAGEEMGARRADGHVGYDMAPFILWFPTLATAATFCSVKSHRRKAATTRK